MDADLNKQALDAKQTIFLKFEFLQWLIYWDPRPLKIIQSSFSFYLNYCDKLQGLYTQDVIVF